MARFQKGQSGNPGGRPKVLGDLREAARKLTPEVLEMLSQVVKDKKAPPSARIAAGTVILDRAYGKPTQHIEAKVDFFAATVR
jgi:hypothetical protein